MSRDIAKVEGHTNLVRDLKNPLKKDSKTSNYLNNLGQRTLENTMGKINNFIK